MHSFFVGGEFFRYVNEHETYLVFELIVERIVWILLNLQRAIFIIFFEIFILSLMQFIDFESYAVQLCNTFTNNFII